MLSLFLLLALPVLAKDSVKSKSAAPAPVEETRTVVDTVTALAWSADGQWIVSGATSGMITVLDAGSGDLVAQLEGHSAVIRDLSFGPAGQLASASNDDTYRIWTLPGGQSTSHEWIPPTPEGAEEPSTAQSFSRLRYTRDGRCLVGGTMAGVIVVWDATTGDEITAWQAHGVFINDLGLSADGSLLATTSWDHMVRLWDPVTGESVGAYEGTEKGAAFVDNATAVAVSPDGQWVLVREEDEVEPILIPSQVSQDGQQLAAILNRGGGSNLALFDLEGGAVRIIVAHRDEPKGLAFHPNRKWVATSAIDGAIRIWDTTTGGGLREIGPNTDDDGPLLPSGSAVATASVDESFENNEAGWDLESEYADLKIKKGVLEVRTGDWNYFFQVDDTDLTGEFTLEARMRKTKGNNDRVWYGLVWGYESNEDFYDLLSGCDSTYGADIYSGGELNEVIGWMQHDALERNKEWNTLRVQRRAERLDFMSQCLRIMDQMLTSFHINGVKLKTFNDWPAAGPDTWAALRFSADVRVEVDYVKITVP